MILVLLAFLLLFIPTSNAQVCTPTCVQGVCNTTTTTCMCLTGWEGPDCNTSTPRYIPYFEDFELGRGGWYTGGNASSWTLGSVNKTVIKGTYSGNSSWITSISTFYNYNEKSYLASPIFDLRNVTTDVYIELAIWWHTENNYDGAILQMSINDSDWTRVGALNDGYDFWYSCVSVGSLPVFDGNKNGWCGTGGRWVVAKHPLPGAAGNSRVAVRIYFASDGSNNRDGIAIDNIRLGIIPTFAPNCTLSYSPVSGSSNVYPDVTLLQWLTQDTDPTWIKGYYVSVGTNLQANNIFSGTNVTRRSFSVSNVTIGVTYYWKVIPYGYYANSPADCPIWNFTVVKTPMPYFEDFEQGQGSWYSAGTSSSWTYGSFNKSVIPGPYSGSNAWTTGVLTHNNSEASFLISPTFDLTNVTNDIYIDLRMWWRTEAGFDGSILQMSVNDGTWTRIGSYNDGYDWYPCSYVFALPTTTGDKPGWCGNGVAWTNIKHPLPGTAGASKVLLRFLFNSDGSGVRDGIAIDNIKIEPINRVPVGCVAPVFPLNPIVQLEQLALQWDITPAAGRLITKYRISVGTDVNATNIYDGVDVSTNSQLILQNLATFTTYYWKVVPYEPYYGASASGCPIWNFTVNTAPFPYYEDFEQGGGWFTGVSSGWSLGTPRKQIINGAASGINCWISSLLNSTSYPSNTTSFLQSPYFDFRSYSFDPQFSANAWWDTETSFDGAVLQMQFANSSNWTTVGAMGEGTNWYNANNIVSSPGGSTVGWSGRATRWETVSHVIPGAAGTLFRLRFVFSSDGMNGFDGFAIDNVEVTVPSTLPPPCATLMSPSNGQTEVVTPLSFSWIVDTSIPSLPTGVGLLVGTVDPPTTYYYLSQNSNFVLNSLEGNTTYYWKILSYGLVNTTFNNNCPVWSFTTALIPTTNPATNPSSTSASDGIGGDSSSKSNGQTTAIIAGVVSAVGVVLIVVVAVIVILNRKKNQKKKEKEVDMSEISTAYTAIPNKKSSVNKLKKADQVIDFDDLVVKSELGSGSSGKVILATWRGTLVAVKELKQPKEGEETLQDFINELNIIQKLKPHVNLILYLGITQNPLSIVMEYAENGSLHRALREGGLRDKQKDKIIQGIVAGLHHLHAEKIIHRDLAARNVLLTGDYQPKISDFGMSRSIETGPQNTQSEVGPLKWMAPESIKDGVYSQKSDIWMFGCVLKEIYTNGEDIYPGIDSVQVASAVAYNQRKPEVPTENVPQDMQELMRRCFEYDPKGRPYIAQILEKYFQI